MRSMPAHIIVLPLYFFSNVLLVIGDQTTPDIAYTAKIREICHGYNPIFSSYNGKNGAIIPYEVFYTSPTRNI